MSPTAPIRAITFDAGGTLIQPWPSVGQVYADVAAEHGVKGISPELLNKRFAAAWMNLKNFQHSREEWSALVDRVFDGLTERPPGDWFFSELFERFAAPEVWRIFDDVKPAIDALASRGINLAVVSNWDDRLKPLLEGLGLSRYFETVVISCDIGFSKPSPVIFEHVSRKLGEAPESILHVGDSREHDVHGAESAGFQARLLDRGASVVKPGSIKSLLDLEALTRFCD